MRKSLKLSAAFLPLLLGWSALAQEAPPAAEPDPAPAAEEPVDAGEEPAGDAAGDEPGDEELYDFDISDLDEQSYDEEDDGFVPTEEIPADEPIPFPSDI